MAILLDSQKLFDNFIIFIFDILNLFILNKIVFFAKKHPFLQV